MNLCIIPARSSSSRIKHKNIKNVLGRPVISYAIKSALKSKCFEDIIVSTDSTKN
jgi:CMP-N-acetylneuraminic acid synthetase